MSIETKISEAVERGVLAAMAKLNLASLSVTTPETDPTPTAPVTPVPIPVAKKPGRSKKANSAVDTQADAAPEPVSADTPVINDAPLPPPAPAPLSVTVSELEADRATLITLTSQIPDGRKVATDLIRQHGPKFDNLAAEVRATILAELTARVSA